MYGNSVLDEHTKYATIARMTKTKSVVPRGDDHVVQAHAISRAAYSMPVLLRRLVYLAMAYAKPEEKGFMDVTMKVGDIARALDMGDAGPIYTRLRRAVTDAVKYVLEIDLPDKGWEVYTWFSYAKYSPKTDSITLRLNEPLRPYVLDVQKFFTPFAIADIAKLQGRHSLRWYELVLSRQSQADAAGHWWYEVELDELRHLFKIGPNEYASTNNLRRKVIDAPVQEINEAGLGLRLDPEFLRHGRELTGVRMHCQRVGRDDPKPVKPPTPEEAADDALKAAHPKRYAEILADIRAQEDLPGMTWASPNMRDLAQQSEALARLRAEVKPKRGRPKSVRT